MTLFHGFSGLIYGNAVLGDISPAIFALAGSLVFEIVTLSYAYHHINKSAKAQGISFFAYLKCGADPTTVQVFMEDVAAISGVAIATVCLSLAKLLDMPFLDVNFTFN